jgi:hypothetical protein
MVSVNDGYLELDVVVVVVVIVVDDGNGFVDFVVTALDDCAYSVLFDKLAIDGAGAGTLAKEGGGVAFRLVVVVVVGVGGTEGGGGTDGTLNLNGSIDGCSGGSGIISI